MGHSHTTIEFQNLFSDVTPNIEYKIFLKDYTPKLIYGTLTISPYHKNTKTKRIVASFVSEAIVSLKRIYKIQIKNTMEYYASQ